MELLKQSIARFRWKDVTFLIKTRASAGDKFTIDACDLGPIVNEDGKVIRKVKQDKFGKLLVQLFVVGWEGVTQDEKPVPYSYEALDEAFPSDPKESVWLALCTFIVEHLDIFKKDIEIKKDLREQSNGRSDGQSQGTKEPILSSAPVGIA